MRTLTRTIIVFVALNLITAGFALAQSASTNTEPVPAPVPSILPDLREDKEMNDLLVSMSLPSTVRRAFGISGTSTVLVIPSQEIKTEELLTITEDMNVMSRIFEKNLNQTRLTATEGNWVFTRGNWASDFWGRGNNTPQGMYLQGYGALFLMNVDFPLSAPPEVQEQEEKPEEEEEDVDQVWEQTRQQMYEPQETRRRRRRAERQEVKYDPQKVENLKTTLIQALKHAANIRVLKPEESVILSVTGGGTSGPTKVITTGRSRASAVIESTVSGDLSPTVLVIRAKRADIDTFAKGEVDLEKFREKVQILSYPLLGVNVAGASTSRTLPARTGTGTY